MPSTLANEITETHSLASHTYVFRGSGSGCVCSRNSLPIIEGAKINGTGFAYLLWQALGCYGAHPIALKLSSRLARRIFNGRLLPGGTFVYQPCLRNSTLRHILPNAGVLCVPEVFEGFGEQAIAKPLSAASGRQAIHPYRSRGNTTIIYPGPISAITFTRLP